MKIGYIRSQKETPNPETIKKMHEIGVDKIILDIVNTTHADSFKETLTQTISEMVKKDILVVDSLDDLGDNVREVIEKLVLIEQGDIGIRLLCIDEENELEIENNWNLHRNLRKQLLGVLRWVEDKKNSEYRIKTVQAIQYMKSQRGSGRPKKYSRLAEDPKDREKYFEVVAMLKENIPIKRISDKVGIARNTIYTIKEEMEEDERELEE